MDALSQPKHALRPSPQHSSLRRWHRRIAWVALIAACTFALTGLLHPLMTRLQPQPATRVPPPMPALDASLPAPAAALAAAGVTQVSGLRPVHDGTRWLWRVQTAGEGVRYLAAATGAPQSAVAERIHAERLARWYAGELTAATTAIEKLTAFDVDYGYTNRLLPVWRVRFARDDALAVYVSTEDDRLATISDARKRVFQQSFHALHTWAWLPALVRNGWINVLLAGVALTTLAGLVLAARTRGGRRLNLRRAHRWGGATVSLAVLAWAVSGFVQALDNGERERADSPQRPLAVRSAMLTAPLAALPQSASGVALVSLGGEAVWRWALQPPQNTTGRGLAMGGHQHHGKPAEGAAAAPSAVYVSALTGQTIAEGERQHLAELIAHFGVQARAEDATAVLKFTPDYGFLFKRLPVWKLTQDDAERSAYYLDTASERLAARITDGDRWRGALFAYAHKWEWITPLAGKDVRDGAGAVFALLLIGVAAGGTLLRRRSR